MDGLHPWWPAGLPVHPHLLLELLAYTVGFQLFLWLRRRRGDPVQDTLTRAWLLAAAVCGAALGSKALWVVEDLAVTWSRGFDPLFWMSGRSIVGGLLGGWAAVELAKRALGVRRSTGDLLVLPLCVGMVIGRVGCFLSGVTDGTHGVPTDLPWGMDLGDGVPRHPTAVYEIVVLVGLAVLLGGPRRWLPLPGDRFLAFLGLYLLWRLFIEALKTQPAPYLGLSAIQVVSLGGIGCTLVVAAARRR